MFTNDLKKGDMVQLRNGWKARIEDNMRGNTRLATVYGIAEEMGSIYAHNIMFKIHDGALHPIQHTPKQLELRQRVESLGF